MKNPKLSMDMETLYQEYSGKASVYIRSRVCNRQDAEDILSNVFVKVAEHLAEYDPGKSGYGTWIYTITQNTVLDYFRTTMRHPATASIDDMALPSDEDIEGGLNREENLERLAEVLAKLPTRERDVIILRYYRDLSPREVSEAMHISYANARYLQSVALTKLRTLLPDL